MARNVLALLILYASFTLFLRIFHVARYWSHESRYMVFFRM